MKSIANMFQSTSKVSASRQHQPGSVLLCSLSIMLTISQPILAQTTGDDTNTPAEKEPAQILAARFVSPEILNTYSETVRATFSLSGRTHDPFGQAQDPNAKPAVTKTKAKGRRFTPAKPTSFSDIIRRIPVTTIMPAENRFLTGTRSFRTGDRFPIAFRGRAINVEVGEVTATYIEFENTSNGEVASVQLNLLPPGMLPGNSGISAPGMSPDEKGAPLIIDANSNF